MKPDSRLTAAALAAAFVLSLPALAAEPPGQGAGPEGGRPSAEDAKRQEMQQKMKERVLAYIDARIKVLQTTQSCVRAATDIESMAICHAQERKLTKDLRDRERAQIQERKASPGPAQR